jgi:hypothetical protein
VLGWRPRIAGHEAEPVDLRREVGQEKIRLRVCLQIIEAEVGKIGNEDVFGKFLFGYAGSSPVKTVDIFINMLGNQL